MIKALGVHEVTYYRWRKEYGGLQVSQAKRLKDLERENARLRKAVSDLTLDKLILQEASRGNLTRSACAAFSTDRRIRRRDSNRGQMAPRGRVIRQHSGVS